jgi:hypothetical protein
MSLASLSVSQETGQSFMDGFLLLALVLVYLVISYVPVSKAQEDIDRDKRASQRNTKMDAATRR